MQKKILKIDRVRKITPGFSYIPNGFYFGGFLEKLCHSEIVLYVFLIVVGDQHGLSHYHTDRICSILGFLVDELIEARRGLIKKDLLAFENNLYQVLSLPKNDN